MISYAEFYLQLMLFRKQIINIGEFKMKDTNTKKITLIIIGVLIALTAVFAIVHFASREEVPEGALAIEVDGSIRYVDINKIDTVKVEGTVVNGKGEEKAISADGILLKDLIKEDTVGQVTVTAVDEYSADIEADEYAQADKVYLLTEDGKANLVVFGDSNSKRNVTNVVKIEVK